MKPSAWWKEQAAKTYSPYTREYCLMRFEEQRREERWGWFYRLWAVLSGFMATPVAASEDFVCDKCGAPMSSNVYPCLSGGLCTYTAGALKR